MNPVSSDSWFKRRLKAFADAGRGVVFLFQNEPAFWVHSALTMAACALAIWLGLSPVEWAVLCVTMGVVWVTEALNTAIEKLCDVLHPQNHPGIGKVKDVSAAAVLISAIASVCVGIALFGPKLWSLFLAE